MKKYIFLIIILSFSSAIQAQKKFHQSFDDALMEMENDRLILRFFNAITGRAIVEGYIKIENLGTYQTDNKGRIFFEIPKDGSYKVIFLKSRYIETSFDIEIQAGTLFFNRFSISPKMDLENFRIVLDWDKYPKDLDANFVKKNSYHISYRNKITLPDNRGKLDIDDRDGFGPETITVKKIEESGTYTYFVEDYSNKSNSSSKKLSQSKATVKVYGNGKLQKTYTVPKNQKGTIWTIFKVKDGKIIDINSLD